MLPGRFFIMRHGETVFNAAARLQSNTMHTPLTERGMMQAIKMGEALKAGLGPAPALTLHVSDTGRALQTLGLIAETLHLDWFAARQTPLLREIDMGSWCGRHYREVEAEVGPILDDDHLLHPAPDGEDYPMIAARLRRWLSDIERESGAGGTHLVVMHGISSRVLRGVMTGLPDHPRYHAPIAPGLRQGSISLIENGAETLFHGSPQGGVLA